MTRLLVSLLLFSVSIHAYAQRTSHTMSFDGVQRTYATYVPDIYHQDSNSVPLVVNLHGISDNALNFTGLGYDDIADTANFIIVAPQALDFDILGIYTIERIWNSGVGAEIVPIGQVAYPNSTIDDVGFINALIDSMISQYAINTDEIYVTGFSMGAFMTTRLVCELGDRFAAAAPIAGTIGESVSCNNTSASKVPMMYIHGTADVTVPYDETFNQGGDLWRIAGAYAEEFSDYWADKAACGNVDHIEDILTNANPSNNVNVTTRRYFSNDGLVFEHFRIDSVDHVWSNSFQDEINYEKTIWRFFRSGSKGYNVGCDQTTSINEQEASDNANEENYDRSAPLSKRIKLNTNPRKDEVTISVQGSEIQTIRVIDILGSTKEVIDLRSDPQGSVTINVSDYPSTQYLINVVATEGEETVFYNKLH